MNKLLVSVGALALIATGNATADTYALSPDGLAVVRLVSSSAISASSFNSSLLPSGYASSTATGGSVTVSTYDAGFQGGGGGGRINALFTPASAPGTGNTLRWAQVLTTNDPLGGKTSPYLDTQGAVFYDWAGSTTPLPTGQLPFYDFSKRPPSHLSTINPIEWNAALYPTVVDASNNIEVHDGISWGWTMKKAPVGTASATFTNPSPATATVSGVGTSNFSWGIGDPSSLSFAGAAFDTTPGTKFKIGTLIYHNGTILGDSGADSVDFEAPMHFTNIPELDFVFKTTFTLVNTPNIDGDPVASADQVTIGSFGYSFNVLEGESASVDIMATLDTSLLGTPGLTASGDGSDFDSSPFDTSPVFIITGISLANASSGGFISQVPEPTTWLLLILGLLLVSCTKGSWRFGRA